MAFSNSRKGQYAPGQQPGQVPGQYPGQFRPMPQPGAFGAPVQPPTVSLSPRTLLIIGAIAVVIILTFTAIFVIRANMPHCPTVCKPGVCDTSASCSKDTQYQCVTVPKEGCDIVLETQRITCSGKNGTLVKWWDATAKQCFTDVDPGTKITPYVSVQRPTFSGSGLRVTPTLNQPFNLKKDEVTIDVVAEQLTVQNLRITHIEMDGTGPDRNVLVLGEDSPNKAIAAVQTPTKLYLKLDMPGDATTGTVKDLKLLIDLSYSVVSGSTVTEKTNRLSVSLSNLIFNWLRPSRSYPCPATCEGDPSMHNYCDASSAPFCKHEPLTGACGNSICEANENKCTCPADCGTCTSAGKVTTSQCVSNACQVQLRPTVVVQPLTVPVQNKIGKVDLTTTLVYNSPFNTKSDTVGVTISMNTKDPSVTSFSIDSMQLLKAAGVQESSQTLNSDLAGPGSTATAQLTLPTQLVEEDMSPQLQVFYTIVANGRTDKGSYNAYLQKITVYNPG